MLSKVGGDGVVLQALVIFLLALCLLGSASSILITLYNSVSNPYETYMGPLGLYVCSSASGKTPAQYHHTLRGSENT